MDLNKKKISLIGLFLSFMQLVYVFTAKDFLSNYTTAMIYFENGQDVPLKLYTVEILFTDINYISALIFSLLLIGLFGYLLLFKEDSEIHNSFKKVFRKNNSMMKIFGSNEPKLNLKTSQDASKNRLLRIFLEITLAITLIGVLKTSFYISFFLPLSYYYYITLNPKSQQNLLLKAFGYPLLFAVSLLLLNAHMMAIKTYSYEDTIYNYLGTELMKIIIPYFICSFLNYHFIKRKMASETFIAYKPAYFIAVVLFSILGVIYFITKIYIDNSMETMDY